MIIQGIPGSGKTTKLIKMSRDTGYNLVVSHPTIANKIKYEALKESIYLPEVLTYADITGPNIFGKRLEGLLIDDIELFIEHITKHKAMAISTRMGVKKLKLPLRHRIRNYFKGMKENDFYAD